MHAMKNFLVGSMVLAAATTGFAQTVTIGTPTSAASGGTTTVTIPVTVSTPPAVATTTTSSLAILDVTVGNGDGTSTVQTLGPRFATIALPTVVKDSAKGWNTTTSSYTVPATGTYLIISRIRLVDGTTAGISYGQGTATQNVDGPYFSWSTVVGPRNSALNFRMVQLQKGDAVNLFSYVDSSAGARLNTAELTIEQVQ